MFSWRLVFIGFEYHKYHKFICGKEIIEVTFSAHNYMIINHLKKFTVTFSLLYCTFTYFYVLLNV